MWSGSAGSDASSSCWWLWGLNFLSLVDGAVQELVLLLKVLAMDYGRMVIREFGEQESWGRVLFCLLKGLQIAKLDWSIYGYGVGCFVF